MDANSQNIQPPSMRKRSKTVVIILGLMGALPVLLVVSVYGYFYLRWAETTDKNVEAFAQVRALSAEVERFKQDFRRYPTTHEGFNVLVNPPDGRAPYLPAIPQDPWGHNYSYRCPGTESDDPFEIESRTVGINSWRIRESEADSEPENKTPDAEN